MIEEGLIEECKSIFDDNSLTRLTKFINEFFSFEDYLYCAEIEPLIIEAIYKEENSEIIFKKIYDLYLKDCMNELEVKNYYNVYKKYMYYVTILQNKYVNMEDFINNRTLKIEHY